MAAEPRSRPVVIALLLAAVTIAIFSGVFRNGFVSYDDELYVLRNPQVRSGLSLAAVSWAFAATEAANWHPLTWISHMTDVSLFGLSPAGHHGTSLLFHAASVALVFLLLRRGTGQTARSAVVAAVFGLHPLRVESVAWIAERKDVLSLFFGLLAVGAWGRWALRRDRAAYAASLLFFAFSLMSKPMLVTLPLLFLILDGWPLRRFGNSEAKADDRPAWGALLLEKVPFAVLSGACALLTLRAQRSGGAMSALSLSLPVRLENAAAAPVRYLGKMFWPADLAVFYPHPAAGLGWRTWAALAVLAAISALVYSVRRRRPFLLAGWVWYLVGLVPVLGIVQVGWQGFADRYTYLPSLGIAVAVVWGLADLVSARAAAPVARKVLAGAAAAVLVALSVVTVRQVATWKDSLTLFTRALAVTGPNETMEIDLGNELARRGRTEEAARHFEQALRIAPGSKDVLYALGTLAFRDGRFADARARFEEAARLHPGFAEAHVQIGASWIREGRPADAVPHLERALAIRPDSPEALYALGSALDAQGRAPEAEARYKAALAVRPAYPEAHVNLADLLLARGRRPEAIRHYEAALRLNPEFAEAREGLEAARRP